MDRARTSQALLHQRHRHWRNVHHLLRYRAEEERAHGAAAVCAHHDLIGGYVILQGLARPRER